MLKKRKSLILIFGRTKWDSARFFLGHERVEIVTEYTYLGIIFHESGLFTKAINKQKAQARKAMHALLWRIKRLNLSFEIALELLEKLVLTVLLYGAEIWGFSNLECIEVFHRQFLKNLLGVHKSTNNVMVYGEVGKPPLEYFVTQRMVSFWCRLCTSRQSKISSMLYKLAYKMHYDVNVSFESDWITSVESKLANLGLNIHHGVENYESANQI